MSNLNIKIFITNFGKYNEGELIGEWLTLPTTSRQLKKTFDNIGIDGVEYEEWFITDYDIEIEGLYNMLSEYENLDMLNYLAYVLNNLDVSDIEKLEAVLEYTSVLSIKDLINLIENLDYYTYCPDIHSESDLGYYIINNSDCYDTTVFGDLIKYFDYDAFGRDILLDNGMITKNGYICSNNNECIDDIFSGTDDIPEEYIITNLKV